MFLSKLSFSHIQPHRSLSTCILSPISSHPNFPSEEGGGKGREGRDYTSLTHFLTFTHHIIFSKISLRGKIISLLQHPKREDHIENRTGQTV